MKWFKHFTDASDDEFIAELEERFGLEGYARWWKLLEVVGAQFKQGGLPIAAYPWPIWQAKLRGKRNKLETFLVHLENNLRINQKLTGNILEIKIPKLLEIKDEYSRKSGHTPDTLRSPLPLPLQGEGFSSSKGGNGNHRDSPEGARKGGDDEWF